MMFKTLFKPRPAVVAGRRLHHQATAQSRLPAFYVEHSVSDSLEGRFELQALHVILLVRRFKGAGGEAAEVSQAMFDTFLKSLDEALRDIGVGDLSVSKKMKKLGRAVYGRIKSLDEALAPDADPAALTELVARTVHEEREGEPSVLIADYIRRAEADLAAQDLRLLIDNGPAWPAIGARAAA